MQKFGHDFPGPRLIGLVDHDGLPVEKFDLDADVQRTEMIVMDEKWDLLGLKQAFRQGKLHFVYGRKKFD